MYRRIMIVDDDTALSELICDMLSDEGYEVIYAQNTEETYEKLEEVSPHLILLDINLPDGDGFELCQEIRTKSQVPVIFASARTSENDKVNGLDMGGDDYLAKPYSLKELMSRIRALLRRAYGNISSDEKIVLGKDTSNVITIDRGSRVVERNGKVIEFSPKEYELLMYMIDNKGKTLSKEELINAVWGMYSAVEQSTLTVHIRWLREKLEENPSKPEIIQTVWGVGYNLRAE